MSLPDPHSRKNAVALAAVCLAALMFGLEISSVPVVLPILEKTLHGSFRDMQWIMNAYTIACTTVLMAAGTLADRYGRKRMLVISLIVFGLTSILCGLARSVPVLVAGRFLQGLGGGAMLICLIAILSHQFRAGRERATAFATWGIVFGFGLGFGPILGAAIVAVSSWQWVFLVHGVLAVLAIVMTSSGVEESRDPDARKLDIGGILTLSLAVFSSTYFITQGPDIGFGSAAALGALALALVSFVAFLVVERLHPHPMFDFTVFRIRPFSGAIFGAMGMNFSFWPFMIYLPIYFQSALGYDVVTAGCSLLAYTLPTLVFPPLAERFALRYEPRAVIALGMFAIGLGFLGMRYAISVAHPSWSTILPGALLAGMGLGFTNTPVTNTTTGAVPSTRAGMASGIDMSARLITLAINIALMGFILVNGIRSYLRGALPGALDEASLRAAAEKIASGDLVSVRSTVPAWSTLDASGAVAHAALVHGFGTVMLYGGIGVWVLAAASFLTFGGRASTSTEWGRSDLRDAMKR
ncbi:MFS transporter [Pendulispora albinea]|uniref:MFS transporter n=1 Tax=Pendulispora albinea TaxID=2741071 RepID=A0ABZ2LSG8_9BACT